MQGIERRPGRRGIARAATDGRLKAARMVTAEAWVFYSQAHVCAKPDGLTGVG